MKTCCRTDAKRLILRARLKLFHASYAHFGFKTEPLKNASVPLQWIAATHLMISLHTSVPQRVDEYPCHTNIEPTHFLLPYHYIIMQGLTDKASVPTTYVID
jgi:hypothetical protein